MEASPPAQDPVKKSNRTVLYIFGGLLLIVAIVAGVFLLTRQSEEEKALEAVCTSRADIAKRVDNIASTGITDFTVNGFKENISGIQNDLKTIKANDAKLNPNRKQEIQSATTEFTNSLTSIAKNLGTDLSLSNAQTKLEQAGTELVSSYKASLEPVDCSGVDTGGS